MINKVHLTIVKKIPTEIILKEWIKWLNNKKVSKYSSRGSKKHTLKSQKKFIKEKNSDKNNFLFLIKFENIYIGVVELYNIDKFNKNCEIRYLIGNTDYWNKGIAAKSIKLATKFGFEKIKLKTIYADTHQENIASQKVLKKNYYKLQGKIKNFFSNKSRPKDKIIFAKNKF